MNEYKFEPWETFSKFDKSLLEIDVVEPPCKHCKHWHPIRLITQTGEFDGVRLCHAHDQFPDFSCFTNKDQK